MGTTHLSTIGSICICLVSLTIAGTLWADTPQSKAGDQIVSFRNPTVEDSQRAPGISYDLDLTKELFLVHIPPGYNGSTEKFGLVVFIYAGDEDCQVPAGWTSVLDRRKLVLISPLKAGNGQTSQRRRGLAALGAMAVIQQGRIDPQRVFVSGFSGGSRIAGQVAIMQPALFRGTIQNCGADFDEPVPQSAPRPADRPATPYGYDPDLHAGMAQARDHVKLVFVTGPGDFRHGDILDIGAAYTKAGFQAKIIDQPAMDHNICGAKSLNEALDFIDPGGNAAADTAGPTAEPATPKAAWISRNISQWPQIVLTNDARIKPRSILQGASGFLMKLPNGAIVAATARHVMADVPLNQFATAIQAWTLVSTSSPQRKVTLGKLAIAPDAAESLDCLLMTVPRQTGYPAEVLPARSTPVEEGETVYLVTVQNDGKAVQTIYKGMVRRRSDDQHFAYEVPGSVETRGFSGAPIIDEKGNVVGLHQRHYEKAANVQGTLLSALDISQVIPLADVKAPIGAK